MVNSLGVQWLEAALLGEVMGIEAAVFHMPWTRGMFEEEIVRAESVCLAAESDGALVGYAICRVVAAEEAELLRVAVSPRARRRGAGSALMRAMMDELKARGVRMMHLEVRESNEQARALYRSHGFRDTGRRRSYYEAPPEDAILMGVCIASP